MKLVLFLLVGLIVVPGGALLLAIAWHPQPIRAFPAITEPFTRMDLNGLPPLEQYTARDGAPLTYRRYQGAAGPVVVLIHGSSGSSQSMHQLAQALSSQAGATVLVPDLRGHGPSYPHGDVAYVGQLEDDLADLLAALKPAFPARPWTLAGFSSGGGFTLRMAASPQGAGFDRFLLLSPYLHYQASTQRPTTDENRWCTVAMARIIALSILNRFGLHRLDGLAVMRFPVPAGIDVVTESYSWRMQQNFAPHLDYQQDIARATRPMELLVGGADELFRPEAFAPLFPGRRVEVLDGVTHAGMITEPKAIAAIVRAVQGGR